MILNLEHLPRVIPVGIQTESGVEAIGFDLSPWMTRWPDLTFAVWPTRPGESASYIAANTELVGNVLYWYPNAADTEKEGAGTVEVVGIGGGKCKSSGVIDTLVKKTSLDVTQETPEPFKPWFEELQKTAGIAQKGAADAAASAEAAAEKATEAGQHANAAAQNAANAGKLAQAAQNHAAEAAQAKGAAETSAQHAEQAKQEAINNADDAEESAKDAQVFAQAADASAGNAAASALAAAASAQAANNSAQIVQEAEWVGKVFLITISRNDAGQDVADHSAKDIENALSDGKAPMMIYGGMGLWCRGFEMYDGALCPAFYAWSEYSDKNGAVAMTAYITADNVVHMTGDYTKIPNPQKLTIKQGKTSTTYDGSEAVTVNVPDVLIVTVGSGNKSSHTAEQIDLAKQNGKAIFLLHDGNVYSHAGYNNGLYEFELFDYVQTGDQNAASGVGIHYWRATLQQDGTFDIRGGIPARTPNPSFLLINQGGTTSMYDGSTPLVIDIPTGGVDEESVSKLVENKVNAILRPVILPETTVEGEGAMPILTPLSGTPEAGMIYAVTYNGTPYDCPARYFEVEDSVGVVLGNTDAMGLPGGNTAAPFTIALLPDGEDLMGDGTIVYGVVSDMGGVSSATISIVGTGRASGDASDVFIVNVTSGDSILTTADKPYEDAVVAIASGKTVYFRLISDEGVAQSATFVYVREQGKIVVTFHYGVLAVYLHWNADGSLNVAT